MFDFDYKEALYRRNSNKEPYVWYAKELNSNSFRVYHGIVGKNITSEIIITDRNVKSEIKSRFNSKKKQGYKTISDVKDDLALDNFPVEGMLQSWLAAYLPINRTTDEGIYLPMLAKTYDDKVFERCSTYMGQCKINGLRCVVKPYQSNDMFRPIRLSFQSREGTIWTSLCNLEDYLLEVIPKAFLIRLIENNSAMDGELYLPGYQVNDINHFVKNDKCSENRMIQYWVFDIIEDESIQLNRMNLLMNHLGHFKLNFTSKAQHYNNKERLVVLNNFEIFSAKSAIDYRNNFIDLGFEGLILRNPGASYLYGERKVGVMVKYKRKTDGIFKVINIEPESVKRPDIPILTCMNDINSALFQCHICGTLGYQKMILVNRGEYIGKNLFVEYGERSGVNQLPFHVQNTYFI